MSPSVRERRLRIYEEEQRMQKVLKEFNEQHKKGRLTDDQLKRLAAELGNALRAAARSGEEAARIGAPPLAGSGLK